MKIGRVGLDDEIRRVAVVGGPRPIAAARKARRSGADLVEARVDTWADRDPDRLRDLLRAVRRAARRPIILSIRSRGSGGAWEAKGRGERARLALYLALLKEVDAVEVEFGSKSRNRVIRAARRARRTVILAHYESRRLLGARALEALATRMRRTGADVVKLAPHCPRREDLVEALCFLGKTPSKPVWLSPTGPAAPAYGDVLELFGSAVIGLKPDEKR